MGEHPDEPHAGSVGGLLNRLRAAVLGANDGIVSVAGIGDGLRRRHVRSLRRSSWAVPPAWSPVPSAWRRASTSR